MIPACFEFRQFCLYVLCWVIKNHKANARMLFIGIPVSFRKRVLNPKSYHASNQFVFSSSCILLVRSRFFIFQFFVPGLQLCYNQSGCWMFCSVSVSRCTSWSLWGYVACYLIRNELVAHIIIIHIHKVLVGHRKDSHRCLTYGANGILRNDRSHNGRILEQ